MAETGGETQNPEEELTPEEKFKNYAESGPPSENILRPTPEGYKPKPTRPVLREAPKIDEFPITQPKPGGMLGARKRTIPVQNLPREEVVIKKPNTGRVRGRF